MDFELPDDLIAQTPAQPRDAAKLLVYDRKTKQITDAVFRDLPSFLPENTTLVVNDSKVEKCRLRFGAQELFVLQTHNPTTVTAMVRPGKKFKLGKTVMLADDFSALVTAIDDDGLRTLSLSLPIDDPFLATYKETPFPPYIQPNELMASEYQTVYANEPGSKAAPTAGLHFTEELLSKIKQLHAVVTITLEVGLGTFASLKPENLQQGRLHEEKYRISDTSAAQLNQATNITAVGTTSVRALESYRRDHEKFEEASETTDIFIQPGFTFKAVDQLITNFHLPGTSLLYLVSAFIGSEQELQRIYEHAIAQQYRFYSFGDAMLII